MFARWGADAVNLTALTCLQASNAIVPILIVPIAISRLGAGVYAQVAIAEAMSTIVLAIVLYSFEIDGVARISDLRLPADREALSEALSTTLVARLFLFIMAATVLVVATVLFSSLRPILLVGWLLVPLGYALHSYWFYQGMERNLAPALVTIVARLTSLALILSFVRSPADVDLVPFAVGAPFVLAGLMSLALARSALGVDLRWTGVERVGSYLLHGRHVFLGTGAVMLYREINVLLMGLVGVAPALISSYALAEKGIKMIQAVTRPLNQLFFPKVIRAIRGHHRPDSQVAAVILRFTLPQMAAAMGLMLVLWLAFAELQNHFGALRGIRELPTVAYLVLILSPAPLLGLANFMFGTAGLNFLNDRGYLLRSILIVGVLSVAACFVLSHLFGAIGAAICFTGAEALLLIQVLARYTHGRNARARSTIA